MPCIHSYPAAHYSRNAAASASASVTSSTAGWYYVAVVCTQKVVMETSIYKIYICIFCISRRKCWHLELENIRIAAFSSRACCSAYLCNAQPAPPANQQGGQGDAINDGNIPPPLTSKREKHNKSSPNSIENASSQLMCRGQPESANFLLRASVQLLTSAMSSTAREM